MGTRALGTPRDRVLQDSLHRLQVSDLRAHISQVRLRNDPDLAARPLALGAEPKDRPHLADRKSKQASPADEVQAFEVLGPVEPVAARASCRRRPQAHLLVVADRLDVGAGEVRKSPNRDPTRAVHRCAPSGRKGLSLELLQSLSCSQTWRKEGRLVARLEIKTADELIALDVEGKAKTRRAARETAASKRILRIFLDRGGPIPVDEIVAAFQDGPADAIHQALVALDNDDLIRINEGRIDIAYPFSASPTPFLVRLPAGKERYACCAMDALGIAPMVGQRVEIRSRCHHCEMVLEFSASPDGPGPEAEGVMLWLGKRTEERGKLADSL